MKIKTLRRIRLLLGILSVGGVCFVLYSLGAKTTNVIVTVSTVTILTCIAGIVVTCITRWKEIEKGLL